MNTAELLAAMEGLAAEKPRAVHIKGIGDVFIRELTIGEVDEQLADDDKKSRMSTARAACRLLADADGNRLLDPANQEHVAKMAKLPVRVLREIRQSAEDPDSGN